MYEQDDALGDTARSMEYFVEQHVGEVKKRVSGMTREPDKVVGLGTTCWSRRRSRTTRQKSRSSGRSSRSESRKSRRTSREPRMRGNLAGVQLLHVGRDSRSERLAALGQLAKDRGFTTDVALAGSCTSSGQPWLGTRPSRNERGTARQPGTPSTSWSCCIPDGRSTGRSTLRPSIASSERAILRPGISSELHR